MVRWWAAFFIAGLLAPPTFGMQVAASLLVTALAGWAVVRNAGRTNFRLDGAAGRSSVVAAVLFAVTAASGIVVWEHAGLNRGAVECARISAASGQSGTGGFDAGSAAGRASRSGAEDRSGFRSLSLTGSRARLLELLNDGRLSKRARALVGALILDDRKGLDFTLRETYSYVGITHFLALSGLHLGAIAIPLSRVLSFFVRSKRSSDAALFAILCLYSAVAGFPPSLLRALFLSAAVLGCRSLGLRTDLFGALVAGSFSLVALDPAVALDAGFQLSFTAVCGIAFIGIPLSGIVEPFIPGGFLGKSLKAICSPALITCSVQFFTMPLTVALFARSSLLSPLINVIVSLPFTVLLYAGALYVFIPWGVSRLLLAAPINVLCRFLGEVPAALAAGPHRGLYRGSFWVEPYVAGVALIACALRPGIVRRRTRLAWGIACIVVAFLAPLCRWHRGGEVPGGLVSAAGARDGRRSLPGCFYLPDGGGVAFIDDRFGSREAYRFTRSLWDMGIDRIRVCVVKPSRLRSNHGIYYVSARVSIGEVICSPYLLDGNADMAERLGLHRRSIRPVSRGEVIECASWRLEIVEPVYPPPEGVSVSRNDAGLAWKFMIRSGSGWTMLDLPRDSRYHAVP